MSIFSWLFSRSRPAQSSGAPSEGLAATQLAPTPAPASTLSELKLQRQERREHLYSVVRDVMLRSEVLASHYKFKVLSLDTRGRQFLIMVDLMGAHGLRPDQFASIENLIGITAAQRHDLMVKAVYWRQGEAMVAAGRPSSVPTPPAQGGGPAAPVPYPPTEKVKGFEPIDQAEVQAFKKAIAAATPPEPLPGKLVKSGPRHVPPAPTGFEDTQLLEPDDAVSPLSRTQFGDLN